MPARPKGRKYRRQIASALEERYGGDSKPLLDLLEQIAFGKLEIREPTGVPGLDRVTKPTIGEQYAAILDLLAYQHGRPSQRHEVEVYDERPRWNPDRLSVVELEQLERIAKKGELPEGTVVEGQFTEDKDKGKG